MADTFALTAISLSEETKPVSFQEEKELRRVFDFLCDYSIKVKLNNEIRELENWIQGVKNKASFQASVGYNTNTERIDYNVSETEQKIADLRQQLINLDLNHDKKISCNDIVEIYKVLHHKISKKEVEELIWEADEDLDGCINWTECRLMFGRNIFDKTGLEPSRLYNLIQFLIYDHNQNGLVSVDETMHMLYTRFGRSKMELKLKELFGEDMHETGREGGEIPFSKYIAAVERIQIQTFYGTTKGRISAMKDSYRKKMTSSTKNLNKSTSILSDA